MQTLGFIVAIVAIIGAVVALQAGAVMVATAFLAQELGIGAALSYGTSLVAAVIIDVLQVLFAKPTYQRNTK